MKAVWNDVTIAESVDTIVVEGNHYFPPSSVNFDLLNQSDTHTSCFWKGSAYYYTVSVNGQTNFDAAWYYPNPKEKVAGIKGYIAFWKGIALVK